MIHTHNLQSRIINHNMMITIILLIGQKSKCVQIFMGHKGFLLSNDFQNVLLPSSYWDHEKQRLREPPCAHMTHDEEHNRGKRCHVRATASDDDEIFRRLPVMCHQSIQALTPPCMLHIPDMPHICTSM